MSCEFCGSLMDEGALACPVCGTERRERAQPARQPVATQAPEVDSRDQCPRHPGRPLLGNCPRCGKPVCVRCAPGAIDDNLTCTDCAGMTAAHQLAPTGARCAVHPELEASFVCARCGSFACAGCRATNTDLGLCAQCTRGLGAKASRGARFAANLLDNAVVLLPVLAVVVAAVILLDKSDLKAFVPLFALAGLVLPGAVQLWAQVTWGQSIGKRLLGIKVVRLNGEPIELWRLLLLRNLVVHIAAQACGLFGLVDALLIFSNDQRCLHDYLADSMVVEVVGSPAALSGTAGAA